VWQLAGHPVPRLRWPALCCEPSSWSPLLHLALRSTAPRSRPGATAAPSSWRRLSTIQTAAVRSCSTSSTAPSTLAWTRLQVTTPRDPHWWATAHRCRAPHALPAVSYPHTGYVNYLDFFYCTANNDGLKALTFILFLVWALFLLHVVETTTNE
jgi:hypothetical protein